MNLEDLFDEGVKNYIDVPKEYNFGKELVKELEAEYKGTGSYRVERQNEKEKLNKELQECKQKLKVINTSRKTRKSGSAKRRENISKQVNEKKSNLEKRIAMIKIRLDEISIECGEPLKGDNPSPQAKTQQPNWGNTTPYDQDMFSRFTV